MLERRDTSEPMNVRTCPADRRALIRLVAAATIRERRLFRSALAQVRLLFERGVYSVIYGMYHIHSKAPLKRITIMSLGTHNCNYNSASELSIFYRLYLLGELSEDGQVSIKW